jgi:hypothetical protein
MRDTHSPLRRRETPLRKEATGTNKLLAAIGTILLAVSVAGFLLNRSAELDGSFLFFGFLLVIISVFASQLEGKQEFGFGRVKLNLALKRMVHEDIVKADAELAAGKAILLEPGELTR